MQYLYELFWAVGLRKVLLLMILHRRVALLFTIALAVAVGPQYAANYLPPAGGFTVSVKDFGAKGNGITDDTDAIQNAANLLEMRGGGILRVPAGTYLLNSYKPSVHPWFFYNVRVGSNILIQGEPGARFLQGPRGRSPMVAGASEVRNSVLVFGSANYAVITFQNPAYNGGYLSLRPTIANTSSVTLATPSQINRFVAGDYVGIYSTTTGDVVPSEPSQVLSVNTSTGALNLKTPLARSFSTAFIAKVTSRTTFNVGVRNLTIQGAEPLAATEVFNLIAEDCQFISDTSVTAGNNYGINLNTIRDFRFSRNLIGSVGPSYVSIELPQRNSQDGVFDGNTFRVRSMGFGEYGAHWTFTGNHIWLFPDARVSAMLALGGLDVTFANNDVHGIGTVPLLADYIGPDDYARYVGRITITGNSIACQVDNTNCIALQSMDPVLTDNGIIVTGYGAVGIKVEGPLPQSATIQRNSLNGAGIVLNTLKNDASVIAGNTITGASGTGIYVASPPAPNTGGHVISGNAITGFNRTIDFDPIKHPGTIVTDVTVTSCAGQLIAIK